MGGQWLYVINLQIFREELTQTASACEVIPLEDLLANLAPLLGHVEPNSLLSGSFWEHKSV